MAVNLNLNNSHNKTQVKTITGKGQNQTFGNLGGFVTNALIASDKSPMIGVSIIDLFSMIGPRSLVDATRNGFAATETFFRESAGLIINCLVPSFIVFGMAKLLEKPIMGRNFEGLEPSKFWANQNSNEALSSAWLSTKGAKEERVAAFVSKVLDNVEGLAGQNDWRKIKDLKGKEEFYRGFTKAILSNDKKLAEETTESLIQALGASRNIRFIDKKPFAALNGITSIDIDANLKNLTRDMKDMGSAFIKLSDDAIPSFSKKLTKLISTKSFSGLAVVIAAGASFQYFNRMLTKYRTGSDGFVGDADYMAQVKNGKKVDKKEFCEKERRKLNLHKVLGTLGMGLLATASFGKIPTLKMFQFNGMFPTMNQCRAISAVTYSGRIISSANDNELKETALRDTCTFVNLYYLGDYVSKAFATIKEKTNPALKGKLLNETKALSKNATFGQKFWHWFKHTELKGFEELVNNPVVKKNRAYAQASGLLYSCLVLGLLVPIYNKYSTHKKGLEKQKALEMQKELRKQIDLSSALYQKKLFTAFLKNNNV